MGVFDLPRALASAEAVGLSGDAGADLVVNAGGLDVDARAETAAVSVSPP